EPAWCWTTLAKAEQRVIQGRICRIGRFDGLVEPEPLSFPGIEWNAARIGRPVETRRIGKIVSRCVAVGSDHWKRIVIRLLPREAGEHARLDFHCPQPIGEIGLEDGARADFEEDAVALANQPRSRLGEAHRIAYIAPPVISVEDPVLDRFAGY